MRSAASRAGFDVTVLDYSDAGLREIQQKSEQQGVADKISTVWHDVRRPLPFESATLDAVYSHMLHCMALTTAELMALSSKIRRVLKSGGLNLFTARTKQDAQYGTVIHRGEDMYEVGGFIVHFFDRPKVEQVSAGYDLVSIEDFEEDGLPRKLFLVQCRTHVYARHRRKSPSATSAMPLIRSVHIPYPACSNRAVRRPAAN